MNPKSNNFVGAWELVSHGRYGQDSKFTPSGSDISGQLIYTEDGFMSVFITLSNEPADFNQIIVYSGRYSILADKIVHHIEISPNPKRRNTSEERFFKFKNDILTLTTPPTSEGYFEIKWRKRSSSEN